MHTFALILTVAVCSFFVCTLLVPYFDPANDVGGLAPQRLIPFVLCCIASLVVYKILPLSTKFSEQKLDSIALCAVSGIFLGLGGYFFRCFALGSTC